MTNLNFTFPPVPANAEKSILKPSPSFVKQVYRSAGAVVLFVLVYLLLFIGSLAIAAALCLIGYAVLTTGVGYLILFGVGFIACGLLLIFFVIKFLFRRTPTDYSGKVEIQRAKHPRLFEFIDRLTEEAGSPKPKKVFITVDVNAGVFYASSFWSMFFPVRKNLQIGLGLVNSVNISEFKAIMAHEFGHFSQRSMKFGSYVYNVNKVIYNLLFENDSYEKLLNRWARMHSVFRLMAYININIVKGIQQILKKTYVVVNKTYLALSREMEFHADTVAAYVAGSNQAISSLKRVQIGQVCYGNLLDYFNLKLSEYKRSVNLYEQHSEVIKLYADKYHFEVDGFNLPVINSEVGFGGGEIIEIDDPWSSHPLTEDRRQHLMAVGLNTKTVTDTPWALFDDEVLLQEQLTDILYANTRFDEGPVLIGFEEFKADFHAAVNARFCDELYKNYYDNHDITPFDIDEMIVAASAAGDLSIANLFTDEHCDLPVLLPKLNQNIAILNQIAEVRTDVKNFYYLNTKYDRNKVFELETALKNEYEESAKKIEELDRQIFISFYNSDKSIEAREQLISNYKRLFKYQVEAANDEKLHDEMIALMKPVYSKMMPAQIWSTVNDVYAKEKKVKPRIKEVISDDFVLKNISPFDLDAINIYLNRNWLYYLKPNYDSNAINIFQNAMRAYRSVTSTAIFAAKKSLLEFEMQLLS